MKVKLIQLEKFSVRLMY